MTGKNLLTAEHWKGLTPLLLMCLTLTTSISGTLIVWGVNDIRADIKILSEKSHDLEARVVAIEASRFTAIDANRMMDTIMNKLPPQWLVDKVNENAKDVKELEHEFRRTETH